MKTTLAQALKLLSLIAILSGCSNTRQSLKSATELNKQIADYRSQQSDRVERINREYQDAFAQLMSDFVALTNTRLQQARDADAQLIADAIIADTKSTLIGSLRSSFATTMKQERAAIAQADISIAVTRDAYVNSYTEAKLSLAKVDKVQSDLRLLTEPQDVFATVSNFAEAMVKAQEALSQAGKQATGDTRVSKVKPSPMPAAKL